MIEQEFKIRDIILEFKNWYKYFLSKWKIILIFSVVFSLLSYVYTIVKNVNYTAKLTFALEEKSTSGSSIGALASQFGFNIGGNDGGAFAGDNIIELFKSRNIIEKTLLSIYQEDGKNELLVNKFIEVQGFREDWENKELKDFKFIYSDRSKLTYKEDSLLGVFYKIIGRELLKVSKQDKKLSLVNVSFTSNNEVFSKLFCENLVKNVTNFYVQTKTNKSRVNISLLEHRVDSVRKELDAALYGRANFSDQNLAIIRQTAAVPKAKQEMKVQMLGTMYSELIKNLEFSKLALMREEPLIQIIDTPILPLDNNKIAKKKAFVFGFIFGFILISFYIIINRFYKQLMDPSN